jgi:type IV pilus assembly protein PilM
MFSFLSNKKLIGLDIGTSSIKIAELDVGRRQSSLLAFGIVPTPPQSFNGGDITNAQSLSEAVRQLLTKVKTKRNNAATGLGGTSVIVKRVMIPKMDEKLIPEQIRWEAEQYIPYDINEVNLGFEVLKKTGVPSENMDILLIAAVQGHVFKYVEVLTMAGLNCSVVDVAGFALANAFKANYGDMAGQCVSILNIGAAATTMVVLDNSEVVFCRDIPVGGLNYTADLQKALNVTQDEAEAIKISIGKDATVPVEAQASIDSTHDIVCDEIKASFDFFLNSANAHNISRCFVTGGGSRTIGLMDRISKIIPCEKFDPFFNLGVSQKAFSREYLQQISDFAPVAIGLGLRQLGDI